MPRNTPLTDMIATRQRALDFSAFGLILPNPDPILKARGTDISTYRDLRVDAHVGGCIRRRKSAVKALENGLDRGQAPARVHAAVASMLADLDMDRIVGEMMEAVLYGYQPLEIDWRTSGSVWVPADVVGKPPEWFCFDADNALRLKTRAQPVLGELLPPKKYLLPRQDATYQNPYGFADLSMCFWPVFFKKGGIRLWLAFVEKFGGANWVGKLPAGAQDNQRAELLDALEALISNGVAVIPDDGSVEALELAGKSASADLYERLAMFCRSEVSIALTGTNQTTEANSNKASASAGLEVAADIRDGDAEIVAAAVNQLIRWFVDFNYGETVVAPRWALWDQEARDLLQASRDKSNYDAGAKFTNAYWIRAYGYQEGDLAQPAPSVPGVAPVVGATRQEPVVAALSGETSAAVPPEVEITDDLATRADSEVSGWIEQIAAMVAETPDLPAVQRRLLAAYGDLDSDNLRQVMAAGFALAELRGIDAVRAEGAGNG